MNILRRPRQVRLLCLWLLAAVSVVAGAPPRNAAERIAAATPVELGEGELTLEQVVDVARNHAKVRISPDALGRVRRSFEVVLEAAARNMPVYGLTVGVGLNKDKPVFRDDGGRRVLSEEVLDASRRFNLASLRAHASGVGPPLPGEVVRAAMLIRLNNLLSGGCGAHVEVAESYARLLNRGVVPVVPSQGTVGEADVTLASHIGLVMAGEWEVVREGRRTSAARALREAGITPLRPVAKDFLCIVSNNALVAGQGVLALYDAERYLQREVDVFALSLEGLNGNVAPFLRSTTRVRPFPGMVEAAERIRGALSGSDLWHVSDQRELQDPLSFRTMAYTMGNAIEALGHAREVFGVYMNHTEDNPLVALEVDTEPAGSSQLERYLVAGATKGAIYPTANFEALPFVSAIERASLALAKLSDALTMTILRLAEPEITHLSRFLAAPGNDGHAFGALQKTFVAVNAENRALAMPVSLDSVAVAGNLEDTATHSQLAVTHFATIIDNLYEISSYQLLHASQAVDLRPGFSLGQRTRALRDAYRKVVPFVDKDRIFTVDADRGVSFLKEGSVGATDEVTSGEAMDGNRASSSAATEGKRSPVMWRVVIAGLIVALVGAWRLSRHRKPDSAAPRLDDAHISQSGGWRLPRRPLQGRWGRPHPRRLPAPRHPGPLPPHKGYKDLASLFL